METCFSTEQFISALSVSIGFIIAVKVWTIIMIGFGVLIGWLIYKK